MTTKKQSTTTTETTEAKRQEQMKADLAKVKAGDKRRKASVKAAKKATTKRVEKPEATITPVAGGFKITQATDPLTGKPWEPGEKPEAGVRVKSAKVSRKAAKAHKAAIVAKATEIAAAEPKAKPAKAEKPGRETKGSILIALMQRKNGATGIELQKAAGWQAHSVRGFISAVVGKKLGLKVASEKNDAGERVYSIAK